MTFDGLDPLMRDIVLPSIFTALRAVRTVDILM